MNSVTIERTATRHWGGYTTEWHCMPPERGKGFVVDADEWTDDMGTRRVYIWHYEVAA